MSSVPVVWTHSHGGATGSLTPSTEVASSQSLCASSGRIVAVSAPGAFAVDLFDAHDVADLSNVLGSGRCKMRFIASFPLADIADAVAVHALCFLQGGLLMIAGVCSRGAGALAGPLPSFFPPCSSVGCRLLQPELHPLPTSPQSRSSLSPSLPSLFLSHPGPRTPTCTLAYQCSTRTACPLPPRWAPSTRGPPWAARASLGLGR